VDRDPSRMPFSPQAHTQVMQSFTTSPPSVRPNPASTCHANVAALSVHLKTHGRPVRLVPQFDVHMNTCLY